MQSAAPSHASRFTQQPILSPRHFYQKAIMPRYIPSAFIQGIQPRNESEQRVSDAIAQSISGHKNSISILYAHNGYGKTLYIPLLLAKHGKVAIIHLNDLDTRDIYGYMCKQFGTEFASSANMKPEKGEAEGNWSANAISYITADFLEPRFEERWAGVDIIILDDVWAANLPLSLLMQVLPQLLGKWTRPLQIVVLSDRSTKVDNENTIRQAFQETRANGGRIYALSGSPISTVTPAARAENYEAIPTDSETKKSHQVTSAFHDQSSPLSMLSVSPERPFDYPIPDRTTAQATTSLTTQKKRGRKPKSVYSNAPVAFENALTNAQQMANRQKAKTAERVTNPSPSEPPKKRGRPRKSVDSKPRKQVRKFQGKARQTANKKSLKEAERLIGLSPPPAPRKKDSNHRIELQESEGLVRRLFV